MESTYIFYGKMADEETQTSADYPWREDLQYFLKPFLEYVHQRVCLSQCVPSTSQTHDYGYYVNSLFPLITGEAKSGNASLLAEYNKCIPGMVCVLNVFPEAGGIASTANQVDFFWGKFVGERKDAIEFRTTSLAFNRDSADNYTALCISFIRHASYILNKLVEISTGIIPGQGDGVDPSVHVGPHDTGVPIIKGIYTGKKC